MKTGIGWLAVVLLACGGQAALCQDTPTEQSIEARLNAAPFLMLRGMYAGDKLNFDARGNLIGAAATLPFSMSVMKVTRVELDGATLNVSGYRGGLEFSFNGARAHAVARQKVPLEVVISRDSQHPEWLDGSLSKIFSIGIDDGLLSTAPDYWRPWLDHHLHPHAVDEPLPDGVLRIRRGVTPPLVERGMPALLDPGEGDPEHPAEVVLDCIVDTTGHPHDIHIVQPSGMGRDEAAVESIRQTRFAPATNKGVPVAVLMEMHIQVWFDRSGHRVM